MKEYSSPLLATTYGYANVTDLIVKRTQKTPDLAAFERPIHHANTTRWQDVTISQFDQEVREVAKGLIAIGLKPGENVSIMSQTRYEWAVAESAIWYAGGVVVPIYDSASLAQATAILADTQVRFAFAGSPEQTKLLREASWDVSLAQLTKKHNAEQTAITEPTMNFEPAENPADATTNTEPATNSERLTGLEGSSKIGELPEKTGLRVIELDTQCAQLKKLGRNITNQELETRRLQATQSDVATIVYTSGTTGEPKGALITHLNLLAQVLNIGEAYTDVIWEGGRTIIFLPLAHVLARGLQLVCLASGMKIAHIANPKEVVPALAQLKPTFLVVVPRILQKIAAAAGDTARSKKLGTLWKIAERTAIKWAQHQQSATKPPMGLRALHSLCDRLFYGRLRALMGGQIGYLLSGAGALDPQLALFFRGIGIPVVEGYGLTETTAPITGNLPGQEIAGSVGVPTPGSTIRISADGEVLARGIGVFIGYKNPEHNEGVFVDGFFRTGDLGILDESGHLRLKGRLKDVIVTSGGKTVAPALWENQVENSPLVAHAVVVGEGRPYLSSIIVVDPETVSEWALNQGEQNVLCAIKSSSGNIVEVKNPALNHALNRVIQQANQTVSRAEQIRKFRIVIADLSVESGNITATLKLKRQVFVEQASHIIEQFYQGAKAGKTV